MVEVKFHDIGEGMTEGEVVSYLVKVGDKVKVDQPLVEMQTDKMVAEIPSPASGTVKKIHFDEGTLIKIGSVLLEIDDGTEKKNNSSSEQEVSASLLAPSPTVKNEVPLQKKTPPKRIIAAPHTRRIARENDVDIEEVVGTGPAGRVTDEDIFRFVKARDEKIELEIPKGETPLLVEKEKTEDSVSDTIPFTGIRKQIAMNMSHSVSTIPHVTHFDEADLTDLLAFRQELKEDGENISVVAFFLKALAITLKEFPLFNARLEEENKVIRLLKEYHIGLATNTEKGLVVPVIKDVDKKSIKEIHDEMKALTKRAQDNKLSIHDLKGGTFTISNVGPLGGIAATPIINHPQTSIIAFHKTKKMPVVMENDEIAIRSIMTMSLSFDHRLIDGADSVLFTNRFIELIQQPKKLLLYLR
ncbi:dihydrolipoamide acetyltransferase family protein [Ornithinibacillus halotolerans]|uniref:Dihydrolipoamide acetyltransferase component of pyruvate dehydrogenase complex n=1 Tax=Ornithinibacillus halotolerans TaxID=1274357 RepID=A0A916RU55_9BACI|nr:dihydrolipoamide acetyltransferase family protein [Ornithinibacillus halotolerans]GGA66368.1 dihydrolipoamide acetyltransferase component of pyruvate dehydrogenase complex [Ornithinibacillus halotolerans]